MKKTNCSEDFFSLSERLDFMNGKDVLCRKRFFAFLKENNAYDKWLYNLLKRHPIEDIGWWDNYNQLLYENECYWAILNAFEWKHTKEGLVFWSNLNSKWTEYWIIAIKDCCL